MILHYFKNKENEDKNIVNILYLDFINCTEKIIKNDIGIKEKNFNLVFEIQSILLIVFFIGFKNNVKIRNKNIKNQLMELFINDLDHSFNLLGISDMKIGKYVKTYVKKFYYRIPKLEYIFENNDLPNFNEYLNEFSIIEKNNKNFDSKNFFSSLNKLLKKAKNLNDNENLLLDFIN